MKDECFVLAASTVLRIRQLQEQIEFVRESRRGLDMQPVRNLVNNLSNNVDAARDEKFITPEQYFTLSSLLRGIKDETPAYENDYLRIMSKEDDTERLKLGDRLDDFIDYYALFMVEAVAQCECGSVENRLQPHDMFNKETPPVHEELLGDGETTDGGGGDENANRN